MLKLINITKDYKVADTKVEALKGINLSFRRNEFVSILGPSGCGKTTLLNIIGGLDKYTSGDLYIAGRSTKKYKDRDWDVYRNHRIGFIFQSYNLIPHQTVLGNVELALTIAGISKDERVKKAKMALDRVGLKNQYNKHPNQLSGGQCQRVAIARALVNEPEILLADEPTGALDTHTSIQIMELIKEISKEKLVIMVTHNPELASKYSNRIVKLLDGEVLSDSSPFNEDDEENESESRSEELTKKEKAKMSLFTSLRLSLRNLLSKSKRTLVTCFAGSIGIIGVSAVLAVSSGVKGYIKSMQDDLLSGNPISIKEKSFDLNAIMSSSSYKAKIKALEEYGFVNVDSMLDYLIKQSSSVESMQIENEITQQYIDYVMGIPEEYAASISLNYGLNVSNNIYTGFKKSTTASDEIMSLSAIKQTYTSVLQKTDFSKYASYITSLSQTFQQAPSDEDYILSQYDLLDGKVAKEKNEIMIVIDSHSQLTDLVLAELGYYKQDEFLNIAYKSSASDEYNNALDKNRFSYEELKNKKFTWYPNNIILKNNTDLTKPSVSHYYDAYYNDTFKDGLDLNVVGILKPKKGISYGCLTSGFYYTDKLTEYIINDSLESNIVKYMKDTMKKDTITSMKFQSDRIPEGIDTGIIYDLHYEYNGNSYTEVCYFGSSNMMQSMMEMYGVNMSMGNTITLRELGGCSLANDISIYPVNFELKDGVTDYLDAWNEEGIVYVNGEAVNYEDRKKVTYTDNIAVIISLINSLINIVTTALVCFTALSLVVSCVMIGIITYVSVVERVKEIGVIRSLGGRKRDVSNLFIAETFIIGTTSGLIGIGITYLLSLIINIIVNIFTGVYPIADLQWYQALIMIGVSILLTLISGLLPAKAAAKKDPVVALRTE